MPEWVIHPKNIIIIGASAGGPRILKTIFTGLPKLKASVIIVQHMPKFINDSLRDSLALGTHMKVQIAKNGDTLEHGKTYIAPSEVHLKLIENKTMRLFSGEKVNYVCPSVDVTMKSLILDFGASFIGVVITGMGRDGADGIVHIKKIGGVTIAQDEKTSSIFGMPKEAVDTGCVDMVLTPDEIRTKLIELVGFDRKLHHPLKSNR
jgi:two-component system chemotaxis response regulator CheB